MVESQKMDFPPEKRVGLVGLVGMRHQDAAAAEAVGMDDDQGLMDVGGLFEAGLDLGGEEPLALAELDQARGGAVQHLPAGGGGELAHAARLFEKTETH